MTDSSYGNNTEFPLHDEPVIFDEKGRLRALTTSDAIFDLLSEFSVLRSKYGERIAEQASIKMLEAMQTDAFKEFLFLSGRCVERILDHYREYPSSLLNELYALLEGEFGPGDHGMDLLVNRAVDYFSRNFQRVASGRPGPLITLPKAMETSYTQPPKVSEVNYARHGNITEAGLVLGAKYQKIWTDCLEASTSKEVYLFSRRVGFSWTEVDRDLPILNLILTVLPKDSTTFGQGSDFLKKVSLAVAVNYAQESATSGCANVAILEANLEPSDEAQTLEAAWVLWVNAQPGELYYDAAAAFEAGAKL